MSTVQNYETTQALLRSLEFLAPSLESVKRMRDHPTFDAFEKRWQLQVYFQLRWKDIVSRVESALETTSLTVSANAASKEASSNKEGTAFVSAQSSVVYKAIGQCWTADVYIPDLGHRFWRLTIQVCWWSGRALAAPLMRPFEVVEAISHVARIQHPFA